MTASTLALVSFACSTAQARAAFDDSEPSTPTTILWSVSGCCCALILRLLASVIPGSGWRTRARPEQRHLAQGTGTLVPAGHVRRQLSELAEERVTGSSRGDPDPDIHH